jgi:hypothetical protein
MKELKRFALSMVYPGWRDRPSAAEGYTFIMPAPMDLPFLCYLALAGLRDVDLRNCREILVVPDGWGARDTRALADAIASAGLKNDVRLLPVARRQKLALQVFGHDGVTHWAQIIESIDAAQTDLIFLHDSDAFFTDAALLESSYRLCRSQGFDTLGVTARWDPAFTGAGMKLPGTWELMFSSRWARAWRPIDHKAGLRNTAQGPIFFDTMLYPQYRDYSQGKVQVRDCNSFLHLSGTIVTYRAFADAGQRQVGDELFRLLFLSLLREVSPSFRDECMLPSVAELARALRSPNRVHYRFPAAATKYAEFREFVARLMDAPVFAASRGTLRALIRPFDEHFEAIGPDPLGTAGTVFGKVRAHGLFLGAPLPLNEAASTTAG